MQGRIQTADPLILAPTVRSPTLWQLARAFEGVEGERRGAAPDLDVLRSGVAKLRAGAGAQVVRHDEFAIVHTVPS